MEILKIGESQLAYWDAGAGLPILFIHGVATSGELWTADLADLAYDFGLEVIYSLP